MKERGDKEEAEKEEVSGQKVPLDGVIGDAVGVQADGEKRIIPVWCRSCAIGVRKGKGFGGFGFY